jgi:PBSX family phage terminase large subunit
VTAPTMLVHEYSPRGAALELFHSRADEVVLSGPAGTGKSRGCLEKLDQLCLRNPGIRCLIVRKTLASLGSTALKTYRELVAPEAIAQGIVEFYGGSAEEPPQYRYDNGSSIVIGGIDKPSRIMSSEYDVIYVQESIELTEDDWESLTTRLRHWVLSFQQLIGDTNPDRPSHWLKQRAAAGRTVMLESRHEDNPQLFDDDGVMTRKGIEYLSKLDALTGVRFLRLRKGLWVAAEGVIYEEFDPAIHLVDRFEIPWHWPRYWAVDFGFTHPFVCQRWAADGDGRLFMYAENYHTRRLVEDHAADIRSAVTSDTGEWLEPQPQAIVCDHNAEDRATLERHLGFSTKPAIKTVSDGIQAVQGRLRRAGDGRVRLSFLRDSLHRRDVELADAKRPTCTVEEFPGYVWAPGKEQPIKAEDDGLDATRYVVAHLDHGPKFNMRWL